MTTSTLNQDAPFDPGIDEWCSSERLSCLTRDLAQNISLLKSADVLKNVLRAWVRLQVLNEYLSDDEIKTAYSDNQFAEKKLLLWAHDTWEHRLETIYLSEKKQLDRVTAFILRVKDQYLAFELFNRLKAKEATFNELSWKFGEGSERAHGGCFFEKRLLDIPISIRPLLSKLEEGEILKPHRIGEWYTVMTLQDRIPAQFDDSTKSLLLKCELNRWMYAVVGRLRTHLESHYKLSQS